MITVRFPRHLIRQFPIPTECTAEGRTVAEVIQDCDRQFPGVASYIVHENGMLRPHVNVFIGERMVSDRQTLSDSLNGSDEVFVMQALSGG